MTRIAVIDFETTGISPAQGDRATEVAIVVTEGGRVVDRFQSLMNAGVRIPAFITQLTGITNAMVASAPPAETVMADAARFVGKLPLVAHNASFDRRYWQAELARADLPAPHPFACTVLLSRRLYPEAPSHKLGALVDRLQLPRTGRAHRALADAEMAAELLARIQHDLRERHGVAEPDHGFLMAVQRCSKGALPRFFRERTQAPQGQATPA
ncbi:MAG: 3'-5' exonuclease [Hydrogenophaga sp.]|jgi:DNA polymerase-3 subunit epsilon|nr:3'-5' exonuclease [Hydrogenophaga sp.]